ncbi:MAG: hypothetical protein ACLRYD_02000 [Ruminococcus callidus]|jgi:hypothetical protein
MAIYSKSITINKAAQPLFFFMIKFSQFPQDRNQEVHSSFPIHFPLFEIVNNT